jgi:hypothetical protein
VLMGQRQFVGLGGSWLAHALLLLEENGGLPFN